MGRLILDTTVLIDAERQRRHLHRLIADEDDVAIAAITAAELLEYIPIEDYDIHVARTHTALLAHVRRTGRPRGAHDLIIAATSATSDRLVVSTDSSAFVELPGVALRP